MSDRAPPQSGEGGQVAGDGVDLSKAQESQDVRHMLPNQMAGGAPFMSGPMALPYPFTMNVCFCEAVYVAKMYLLHLKNSLLPILQPYITMLPFPGLNPFYPPPNLPNGDGEAKSLKPAGSKV
jgi:hypothetical protein